jgi:hypothetical protein
MLMSEMTTMTMKTFQNYCEWSFERVGWCWTEQADSIKPTTNWRQRIACVRSEKYVHTQPCQDTKQHEIFASFIEYLSA